MTSFETAATVLGALLVGGALLSGLARRSFLSLTAVFVRRRVRARRTAASTSCRLDPRSSFVRDLAITALVADPVPRRPRGRGRDAPEGVAPAAAQARARHADHRGDRRAGAPRCSPTCRWTEAFLRRRAAVAHRPGAVLERGHQPARAARRSATRSTSSPGSTTASRCRRCWRFTAALAADSDFVWWKFVLQDVEPRRRLRGRHRATSPRACCRAGATSSGRSRPTSARSTRSASPS